ncbi:hypothetical protein FOL47_007995 [Perkinsus chesapeaki]|uniref:Uncharacterized protein n=1 Tax=Perkinsus chesapeaki TaxID=330153 RepID=A0A7J6LGX7_PERCH|nr:hypothetical protein FOL47_007995 [Perkinsus chesapeaki]
MFGVKFEAVREAEFGLAESNGGPNSLAEEENSLASERYILALRKATSPTDKIKSMDRFSRDMSLEESFSLGGAEADWIDSALCCRLKDRVDELRGLIREIQSQDALIDHSGARGLHEDGMDSGRRVVEEAMKDVEMITNKQGSRIVTPRMVSSAEKRVTELRFDGVEEMQASQDCKILFGVPTEKVGENVGLNLQRNFRVLRRMNLETIRDDEEAEVGDWV